MTAIALTWSILGNRPHVGETMRAVKNWVKRNNWWLGWVGGSVLALLGVAILGFVRLDYQLSNAVPELKQALKDATAEIRQDLGKLEERQRQELSSHTTEERASRDRITSNVAALRSHVIELKIKAAHGKVNPADIKDLVSSAQDVSATEASLFASVAEVEGLPRIQTAFSKYEGLGESPLPISQNLQALKAGKLQVGNTLGLMLLAKGGQWDVTGDGLKVRYDGGSATFVARPGTSKSELLRAAGVFNAISQSAQTVGSGESPPQTPKP